MRTRLWYALLVVALWTQVASARHTSLTLSPPPDAEVFSHDLVISATISGPLAESLPLDAARLYVDDKEVSAWCLRHRTFLSYRPLNPISPGEVAVRLEFPNGVVREWTFEVVAPEHIRALSHNGAEGLGEYEEFEVVAEGTPGGIASFHLGKGEYLPMEEIEDGRYRGLYTVQPGDSYLGEPLTVRLAIDGALSETVAPEPVSIFGHIFKVRITSPPSGSDVPNNFPIRGVTRPGSRVVLVPRLSFQRNTSAPNSMTGAGSAGSIDTKADENGEFEVYYGVPISLPHLSVVISVYAVTPEGLRSAPVTLRYHF